MSVREYRFTTKYEGKRPTLCPKCGKNEFMPMIDTQTGELTAYGFCNRETKCGYRNIPSFAPAAQVYRSPRPIAPPPPRFTARARPTELQPKPELNFTSIEPAQAKAVKQLTLAQLIDFINNLETVKTKKAGLQVLLGYYRDRTSGEFCYFRPPYLFYDIDFCQEKELNLFLADPATRAKVKRFLKEISVFVVDSFSRRGLAGLLYAPQFRQFEYDTRLDHLEAAKAIYLYIYQMCQKVTGEKIKFDNAQGKYRQVRYFAPQSEPIAVNFSPYEFSFS